MLGTKIVIIGGGFGGVYAALGLERRLGRDSKASVTLLASENFFLFTPMLPEIAGGGIGTRHIVSPLRKLLRRVRFAEVTVDSIDLNSRHISARHAATGSPRVFEYDHLVLALGGVTNFFNVPGAADNAIPVKTLGDAIYVRNHTIDMLERAAVEPENAGKALTFVIVGGGLTGVEVGGSVNDFVREAARYYPEVDKSEIRVLLAEAGPRLMPEMTPNLAAFAESVLKERGVDVRTRCGVSRVGDEWVEFSTGERVPSLSVIWTAGVAPHPLITDLDIPKDERGRIRTNEYLEVEGVRDLWAIGDCARIEEPITRIPYPSTAQHAVREGKIAARNIVARLGAGSRRAFTYKTMGQLALVGERTGIADLMGHRFSGFVAWFLWRTYYLMRIPMIEKRIRVVMDWTLDLFFTRDLVQLAVSRSGVFGRR
jgi:NADH dehydrogenase